MSLQEITDILYQFVRDKFDIGDDKSEAKRS